MLDVQFSFSKFTDQLTVQGGDISWHLFHQVHEKDQKLDAKLRAASKISASVLHPGNCKQSVSYGLAIFDTPTIAAIRRYFSQRKDSATFLRIFYLVDHLQFKTEKELSPWSRRCCNIRDGKPEFLRNVAL